MKLEQDKLKCVCGRWARPATLHIEGLDLSGWKCTSCGEEYLTPRDSLRLSAIKQLQARPSEATVTRVGNSLAIRIKKEVAEAFNLHSGEKLKIGLNSARKIVIQPA